MKKTPLPNASVLNLFQVFFMRKPVREPISWIGPPPFSRIFSGWQPLLAAVTLTAVKTALPDLCDGHRAKFTPDLSCRWVFETFFFLLIAMVSSRACPCRRSHVPVDLSLWTFLDVTLVLTFLNVNKVSKLWWEKEVRWMTCWWWWWFHVFFLSIHATVKLAAAMAFSDQP